MRTVEELAELARVARIETVKQLWCSQSGHPGSSLSAMDALVEVYFGGYLTHRPDDPSWPDRDIFVLSNGHAAPGYYACLALAGYLDRRELSTLRKLDSRLEGHTKRGSVPGVEFSAGSLGQGLNFATGIAVAIQRARQDRRVTVMMSDGEQQEGSTWEGVMFAGSHRLANLVAIVDVNGNQINGPTHTIHPILDDLAPKYKAFGWSVYEIDGHDHKQLRSALQDASGSDRPAVVISHTVTGKGVPAMEGDYHWHHGKITEEIFRGAMSALGAEVSAQPDQTWQPGGSFPGIDHLTAPAGR
jgi:transketolase